MDANSQGLRELLEELVDSHGLKGVLTDLSEICYQKSQHMLENWQDTEASRAWARNARRIERTAARM